MAISRFNRNPGPLRPRTSTEKAIEDISRKEYTLSNQTGRSEAETAAAIDAAAAAYKVQDNINRAVRGDIGAMMSISQADREKVYARNPGLASVYAAELISQQKEIVRSQKEAAQMGLIKAAIAAAKAVYFDGIRPFSDYLGPNPTLSEKVAKAKELASTYKHYDTEVRTVLQENIDAEELQTILKKWINRVAAWNINPDNPLSPYYGFIPNAHGDYRIIGGVEQNKAHPEWGWWYIGEGPLAAWKTSPPPGIIPGKTLYYPEIKKALEFLGGDPVYVNRFYWATENPDTPWIKTFVVQALIAGSFATIRTTDWNKMIRETVSTLGLDNFELAFISYSVTATSSSGPRPGGTSIQDAFWGEKAYPKLSPTYPSVDFVVIYPEGKFDGGKPHKSKNVFDQIGNAIQIVTPIIIGVGAAYVTGGIASGLLGGGAVGGLAAEKISGITTKEIQKITAPKPMELPGITMPTVTSISFEPVTPEPPAVNINQSANKVAAAIMGENRPPEFRDSLKDIPAIDTKTLMDNMPVILSVVLGVVIVIKLINK